MASIRERTSKSGERTFAVLFRQGGKQTSETFPDEKSALRFKSLVESLGPERARKTLDEDDEPEGLTVAELAEKFLDWKRRDITERTAVDYARDIENWIVPWLGHRTAEYVDEGDVQKWVDHMADRLSPKSVADRHMLLHAMYQFGKARSRRLVSHNPCLETDLPKRKKKPPKGTTVPEFNLILETAGRRNPDARDLILFLGETGWRWSEATALDVRDVEDDGTDVWVTVTRVFRLDRSSRQQLIEDAAKSTAGFRRIRLWPASAAMMRRRLVGKKPGDLVFLNSHGRPWNQNTFLRETWPRIIKNTELGDRRPTPHWLRHMHVAVCGAAKVPMHEIQRRIGHEHYSTTVDVYGKMIGDMDDSSVEMAAEIMAGKRSAPSIAPVVKGEVLG